MNEFAEIGRTGTIVEFINRGGQYSQRITNNNSTCIKIFQVCVDYEGNILDIVAFVGMGQQMIYKQPSVLVSLFSDDEGFFGKSCPKCQSYFRTGSVSQSNYCPYCGHKDDFKNFLTQNQKDFVKSFVRTQIEAFSKGESVKIDLDEIANNLPSNTVSPWVYKEETQQNKFTCNNCKSETDILGEYGKCSLCGTHNCSDVATRKITSLEVRFKDVDENIEDRHQRESEWEKLLRCVSEFEGLANEIRKHLLLLPLTDKRRKEIGSISFQRILSSSEKLNEWFGINIFEGITEEEKNFVNKMFNIRHLFTHNNGQIDQEYIDNTGDKSMKINQLVRLRSKEIKRIIELTKKMMINLTNDYMAIK